MRWINKIAKKPKITLFHYTTIDGLLGIFREKKIWATSVLHLNDKAEFSLAAGIFKNAIEELEKRLALPAAAAITPAGYKIDLRALFLSVLSHITDPALSTTLTYVCSFSEKGDQLSQWRGYCPGGYGFSIGFDYSQLEKHIERQRCILAQCIYKEDEQRLFIDQYVKEAIEPILTSLNDENLGKRAPECLNELFYVLPVLKHETFQEEKEWRLISSTFEAKSTSVKFRAGKTTLIPYYEFELTDEKNEGQTLPIESITIGPTPNQTESLYAVKALLNQYGMSKQVNVIHSKIPYREV